MVFPGSMDKEFVKMFPTDHVTNPQESYDLELISPCSPCKHCQ